MTYQSTNETIWTIWSFEYNFIYAFKIISCSFYNLNFSSAQSLPRVFVRFNCIESFPPLLYSISDKHPEGLPEPIYTNGITTTSILVSKPRPLYPNDLNLIYELYSRRYSSQYLCNQKTQDACVITFTHIDRHVSGEMDSALSAVRRLSPCQGSSISSHTSYWVLTKYNVELFVGFQ